MGIRLDIDHIVSHLSPMLHFKMLKKRALHRVDLAKVEAQQQNGLRPFFSALKTFFFARLSEWNLKKIWINSKKLQPYQFRMVLNGPVGTLPPSCPFGQEPPNPIVPPCCSEEGGQSSGASRVCKHVSVPRVRESERSSRPRRPPYNPVDARVTARANRRAGETGDWPLFN